MRQRAITAAILVPALLVVLWVGGVLLAVAIAAITVLAAREVFALLTG
jgi:CDP-diglyceride synthetase